MFNQNLTNFHVQYMDVVQHWNVDSQGFAGADCLLTALYRGWEIHTLVKKEIRWYGGMRSNSIYHFELTQGDQRMVMPVIGNPFLDRMIEQPTLQLLALDDLDNRQQKAS
jgi:hypothetical protein